MNNSEEQNSLKWVNSISNFGRTDWHRNAVRTGEALTLVLICWAANCWTRHSTREVPLVFTSNPFNVYHTVKYVNRIMESIS
jgi:hypothetical protein